MICFIMPNLRMKAATTGEVTKIAITLLRPRVREPCLLHLGNQQQSLIVKFHHYPFLFPGTNFINSSSLSN